MSQQRITDDLLSAPDEATLARRLRERIQGAGAPPSPEDWQFTDLVERAAMQSRAEPLRGRFAGAVRSLLHDLVRQPAAGLGLGEWPAGLLFVVRRTAWVAGDELEEVRRSLVGLLYNVQRRGWPVGRDTSAGLGSPTLELLRTARAVGLELESCQEALRVCIEGLIDPRGEEADWELGALLGMKASYHERATREALYELRKIDEEDRLDRILYTLDREYRRFRGSAQPLIGLLVDAVGGSGESVRAAMAPTAAHQRWAAKAALRLGEPTDEEQARIDRLHKPAPVGGLAPRPEFAKRLAVRRRHGAVA